MGAVGTRTNRFCCEKKKRTNKERLAFHLVQRVEQTVPMVDATAKIRLLNKIGGKTDTWSVAFAAPLDLFCKLKSLKNS